MLYRYENETKLLTNDILKKFFLNRTYNCKLHYKNTPVKQNLS